MGGFSHSRNLHLSDYGIHILQTGFPLRLSPLGMDVCFSPENSVEYSI